MARRAGDWDGDFPIGKDQDLMPDDIRAMLAYIGEHRAATAPFDVIVNGRVYNPESVEIPFIVQDYENAGVTWMDVFWANVPVDRVRAHISQEPSTT
jgi:hypothetical protein